MSDFRDTIISAENKGYLMDSCNSDDAHYDFGLYTDLCGLSVEELIEIARQNLLNQQNGSRQENIIRFTVDSDNNLLLTSSHAPQSDVTVDFKINGTSYSKTFLANTTSLLTYIPFDASNDTISSISITTEDTAYNYSYTVANINSKSYTLIYKVDNQVYYTTLVIEGTTIDVIPSPSKTGYSFSGWQNVPSTLIMPNNDLEITGTFTKTTYTITFNVNGDEYTYNVEYGDTPNYTGETPTKESTAQYTYTFNKWVPNIVSASTNATYTASFNSTVNQYKVEYLNEDGTLLQSGMTDYGTVLVYTGSTPTKNSTAQYTYTFNNWNGDIATLITTNTTYTAVFDSTVNQYKVEYLNEDGTLLQSGMTDYGTVLTYTGETPAKERTAQYTYTFNNWNSDITLAITANTTYTAVFDSTLNQYKVEYLNDDNTILQSGMTGYGTVLAYTGETPAKERTAQYTYTFNNWDKDTSVLITDNTTYTAVFDSTINQYKVEYLNEDGTLLQSGMTDYGTVLVYTGETPSKEDTAQYIYNFDKWNGDIASLITGNTTYTAIFNSTLRNYSILFKGEDNAILQSDTLDYGVMPSYTGTTPTKETTPQYAYTFNGWAPEISQVTGNQEYTVVFAQTLRVYTYQYNGINGDSLQSGETSYNVIPEYTGATPTKADDENYKYVFTKWQTNTDTVNATIVSVPLFESIQKFNVVFLDSDNNIFEDSQQKVVSGETATLPSGVPSKNSDAKYTYAFANWVPSVGPISSDTTYKPSYINENVKYNVTFMVTYPNGDIKTLDTVTYKYGDTITVPSLSDIEGYWIDYGDLPMTINEEYYENNTTSATFDIAYTLISDYTLILYVDNKEYITVSNVSYGATITDVLRTAGYVEPEETAMSGFTWDTADHTLNNLTMPAVEDKSYEIYGSHYTKQYTVTFNINNDIPEGGTSSVDSITADYGTQINQPSIVSVNGYNFVWNDTTFPFELTGNTTINGAYSEITANTAATYYGTVLNDNLNYTKLTEFDATDSSFTLTFTIPTNDEYQTKYDEYDEAVSDGADESRINALDAECESIRNSYKYPAYILISNSVINTYSYSIVDEASTPGGFDVYGTTTIDGVEYTILRKYNDTYRVQEQDVNIKFIITFNKK